VRIVSKFDNRQILFRTAFYLYGIFTGIAAIVVLGVNLEFKPPAKNLFRDVWVILKNAELVVFFLINLMSGNYQLAPCYTQFNDFVVTLRFPCRCVLGVHRRLPVLVPRRYGRYQIVDGPNADCFGTFGNSRSTDGRRDIQKSRPPERSVHRIFVLRCPLRR